MIVRLLTIALAALLLASPVQAQPRPALFFSGPGHSVYTLDGAVPDCFDLDAINAAVAPLVAVNLVESPVTLCSPRRDGTFRLSVQLLGPCRVVWWQGQVIEPGRCQAWLPLVVR